MNSCLNYGIKLRNVSRNLFQGNSRMNFLCKLTMLLVCGIVVANAASTGFVDVYLGDGTEKSAVVQPAVVVNAVCKFL